MIAALSIAALGVALMAAGTPRQAQLIDVRMTEPRRRAIRIAGLTLLIGSLIVAMGESDRARHLATWIGSVAVAAFAVGLGFSLLADRRSRKPSRR